MIKYAFLPLITDFYFWQKIQSFRDYVFAARFLLEVCTILLVPWVHIFFVIVSAHMLLSCPFFSRLILFYVAKCCHVPVESYRSARHFSFLVILYKNRPWTVLPLSPICLTSACRIPAFKHVSLEILWKEGILLQQYLRIMSPKYKP